MKLNDLGRRRLYYDAMKEVHPSHQYVNEKDFDYYVRHCENMYKRNGKSMISLGRSVFVLHDEYFGE